MVGKVLPLVVVHTSFIRAAVNFSVDDTANQLYDDGPWTTDGHEPRNAVADDHKFGATVFIALPASEHTSFE